MEVYQIIKKSREEKGISQSFVAKALNMPNSTYSMKELGKRPFQFEEIKMLSKLLNIPPDIFFE